MELERLLIIFYLSELNHRLVDNEHVHGPGFASQVLGFLIGLDLDSCRQCTHPLTNISLWPCLGLEKIVLGLVSSSLDSKSDAHG